MGFANRIAPDASQLVGFWDFVEALDSFNVFLGLYGNMVKIADLFDNFLVFLESCSRVQIRILRPHFGSRPLEELHRVP